jgi:hypothetical protein
MRFDITAHMANGTAANVVAMAFGNRGHGSAAGVGPSCPASRWTDADPLSLLRRGTVARDFFARRLGNHAPGAEQLVDTERLRIHPVVIRIRSEKGLSQ